MQNFRLLQLQVCNHWFAWGIGIPKIWNFPPLCTCTYKLYSQHTWKQTGPKCRRPFSIWFCTYNTLHYMWRAIQWLCKSFYFSHFFFYFYRNNVNLFSPLRKKCLDRCSTLKFIHLKLKFNLHQFKYICWIYASTWNLYLF